MVHQTLVYATSGMTAVFLGLLALIILNKAWRDGAVTLRRSRRLALEPAAMAWIGREYPTLAEALGRPPRRNARLVLEEILLDHARRLRGARRQMLTAGFEEIGAVDRLLVALRGRVPARRAEAARRLGLTGATRAVAALAAATRDSSSEVRLQAARALGRLGGAEAAQELIGALREPERWSTLRLADILAGMGRNVTGELIEAYPSLDLAGKITVLEILARIRPLRSADWLIRRLGDPDRDIRARACHALGCIGDPASAPELIRSLGDPDWPVRAMAAKALGRMHHAEAIPALCECMGDTEWWVRSNAAHALRAMGRGGVDALDRMLDSPDRFARHQAVLMLQESGTVDEQVARLADADEPTRTRAEGFVARLVKAGQLDRLRSLAGSHENEGVRQALSSLLAPAPAPAAGPEATHELSAEPVR
jgi:HEAT repeat protein